ncbi:patatin-like phospholipase family protein [Nocardia jejuensis]|uniref:patatin-like phospholipase family protein n=1 Tax=Nocardia jejuensis TaxID=328049 RepID=UPI0008324E0E|nr:patatin-like phospholipase family protein [Nocardia jejuensis]
MSAALPPNGSRIALVLGGGGPVGISWMTGLALTLREAGIDLGLADRIVGTSAGAVVGSVLAGDGDLARLVAPRSDGAAPINFDLVRFGEILGILATPGVSPAEARRLAGVRVTELAVEDPEVHLGRIRPLVGTSEWSDRDLLVTTIDIGTGELRAWSRADGVPLDVAVTASTAVPGIFPAIPIQGREYFDGGMRSPINADLAAGFDLVVIIEPLANVFPRIPEDGELGGAATISVVPDAEMVAAVGVDFFSPHLLEPAYEAGVRQAAEVAVQLKELWPTR